jgi:uncharacterized Zn finger protein (UPF0148 family)
MYQKNCTKCHKPSYSSSEIGQWLCPVCGNDLTTYALLDAITGEQIYVIYKKKVMPHSYSIKEISRNYRKRVGLSYYSKKSSTFDYKIL